MREILCHYCDRVVMRLATGTKLIPGTVCICKRCSEIEGIVERQGKPGESCEVVEDLFKMMGMRK